MSADKKNMLPRIGQEQGYLSGYQRELAESSEDKAKKEEEIIQLQRKLAETEQKRAQMTDENGKFENDHSSFRKDKNEMEMTRAGKNKQGSYYKKS